MARKTSGGHGRIASRVRALAGNLWWSWNPQAQSLFASMHPELWQATHHNPIRTLNLLPPEQRGLIEGDGEFIARLDGCERDLGAYLRAPTWFDRQRRRSSASPVVAYFCGPWVFLNLLTSLCPYGKRYFHIKNRPGCWTSKSTLRGW